MWGLPKAQGVVSNLSGVATPGKSLLPPPPPPNPSRFSVLQNCIKGGSTGGP